MIGGSYPLLESRLHPARTVEPVVPGLVSALPPAQRTDGYDGMAKATDRVVGNGLYNRLVLGASVADYAGAARNGLAGAGPGPIHDCGSMLVLRGTMRG